MGAGGMLDEARKSLGLGEPNHIQDWYADRNGAAFRYNFAWCDAAITYWAALSGNHPAVCPRGDRAYTPWHADDFRDLGQWRPGTVGNLNAARPGDIVFFDWGQSNSIAAIDHVGVIERVLGGGRVQTIEGNTDNRCLRRTRSAGVIAGYGRPDYDGKHSAPSSSTSGTASGRLVVDGRLGPLTMRATQRALNVDDDGIWGPITVRAMQRRTGAAVDGLLGPNTKRAVQRRVGAAVDGIWPGVLGYTSAGIVRTSSGPVSETTRCLQRALNGGKF